jgi:glucose/arabinose dehydrogenase
LRALFALPVLLSGLAVAAVVQNAGPAAAASGPPAGFTDSVVAQIDQATGLTNLPDGRMLVVSRTGPITLVRTDGSKAVVTTLNVCSDYGERGGLGIVADPDFTANHNVYVYYTANVVGCDVAGRNTVSRFTLTGESLGGEVKLIDNVTSTALNHDGGDLHFGVDGDLYISIGDGGTGGVNAHDLSNLKGKILRIAKDGTVPADNPLVGDPNAARCNTGPQPGKKCTEIYAWGLRNPFRFSFDPNNPGRAFVNDVGQDTTEEIDNLVKAGDYGWNTYEGHCVQGSTTNCPTMPAGILGPVFDYTHAATACEAITASAFVPNGAWPAQYEGSYLYGDEVCGKLFLLTPNGSGGWSSSLFMDANTIVSMQFVNEPTGWALYWTSLGGELHKIVSRRSTPTTVGPSRFVPLDAPTRILDTRTGLGSAAGKPAANSFVRVQVAGAHGVPAEATAVALNVTGTNPATPGYITVVPAGDPVPGVSNLNFSAAGETIANSVISVLDTNGGIDVYTQASAHLVVDITGYFTPASSSDSGRYTPVAPGRLLDTRDNGGTRPGDLAQVDVQVTGKQGVPSSGVSAVALAVTVTDPAAPGYVTVWPTGKSRPDASVVNPTKAGETRANLVLVPVGTDGKVSLFTFHGAHLIVDVTGWFTDSSASSSSSGLFQAVVAARLSDSRQAGARLGRLPTAGSGTLDFTSNVGASARAVVYNLTATRTSAPGYVTAYPAGDAVPLASNVNADAAGQSRASLAISSLANASKVSFFASAATDVVIDESGWFTG